MQADTSTNTIINTLLEQTTPSMPTGGEAMTCRVEIPPGDPGLRPHRHSGPVFGYVLEGEMLFELEGEPERLIAAGEPFWEPGGNVIHYQTANNRTDTWTRIIAVMIGIPGEQMLTFVDDDELAQRAHLRGPQTT